MNKYFDMFENLTRNFVFSFGERWIHINPIKKNKFKEVK